jgi:hypothetical protein
MSEWISVNDRLPDVVKDDLEDDVSDVLVSFKRVCCACSSGDESLYYGIGYLMGGKWQLTELLEDDHFPDNYVTTIRVTHWMKLPELPST